MSEKLTLGQAIDNMIKSLESLDDETKKIAINAAVEHFKLEGIKSVTNPLEEEVKRAKKSLTEMSKITDIKTLKEQKKPSSAIEMACIVAYYLQELAPENERADSINSGDIENYFKQANYRLPKAIAQLLINAKSAGYFTQVGSGKYKINPVGYNLVVHKLPVKKRLD